jgi:hypothetical protein
MAEVQPTQDEILQEIRDQLKNLSELKSPPGPPGLQGEPGPVFNPVVIEGRLSRIETKLDDIIVAVKEDRGATTKRFEGHDADIKGIRKGYWIGIGGLSVLSFLSPALVKILFHL